MTMKIPVVVVGLWLSFIQIVVCCELADDKNVKQLDIRIPEIEVPKKLTSYVCQQFKVPDDEEYNAIAFEGLITNPEVVHHILIFGCERDIGSSAPHECGNVDSAICRSWLAQWTIGVKGKTCTHNGTGIRFGKNSYKYISIQIHWNNNDFERNLTDSSGIRLHYTNQVRQHAVENVQVGQNDLEIPTGSKRLLQAGGCSSCCTQRMLPHPIYLTKTYIHMHDLGVEGKLEIYRDGKRVRTVAHDAVYNYHVSPLHFHDSPEEVLPGDEVRLSCWYKSNKNHTIYWGEGSDAEMCYAFITYFPKVDGFDQCVQFNKYDVNCHMRGEPYMGGCSLHRFEEEFKHSLLRNIIDSCQPQRICNEACTQNIGLFTGHPCLKGRFKDYVYRLFPRNVPNWDLFMNITSNYNSKCYQ